MNLVITISRRFGTGASLIAQELSKKLGVPVYDKAQNIITVYLTQGNNGIYNNGKTAAKYQSSDKGNTWKYVGQLELTTD